MRNWELKAIALLVMIGLIALGVACYQTNSGGSPITTFAPITFTGSSGQTTDLFTVTTDTWEVEWSYTPEVTEYVGATGDIVRYTAQLTSLIFYVYPKGKSGDYYVASVFALDPSKTSGSISPPAGAGQYYMVVKCANISSWTINIKSE